MVMFFLAVALSAPLAMQADASRGDGSHSWHDNQDGSWHWEDDDDGSDGWGGGDDCDDDEDCTDDHNDWNKDKHHHQGSWGDDDDSSGWDDEDDGCSRWGSNDDDEGCDDDGEGTETETDEGGNGTTTPNGGNGTTTNNGGTGTTTGNGGTGTSTGTQTPAAATTPSGGGGGCLNCGGASTHPEPTTSSPAATSTPKDEEGEVLGATCEPLITSFMREGKGNSTDQVKKLQDFLNRNLGTRMLVTGVFDHTTTLLVNAFQEKYWQDVLAPWVPFGLATPHTPTGYVYKTTLRKIDTLECPALTLPAPQLP